jgi:hypothetical protein
LCTSKNSSRLQTACNVCKDLARGGTGVGEVSRSVQVRRGFMGFTIAPLQKRADQAGPVGSAAVFGPVGGAPPARGSPARDRLATPLRGET